MSHEHIKHLVSGEPVPVRVIIYVGFQAVGTPYPTFTLAMLDREGQWHFQAPQPPSVQVITHWWYQSEFL